MSENEKGLRVTYAKKFATATPAKGIVGDLLLPNSLSSSIVIRVRAPLGQFEDCRVAHGDLLVQILDDFAALYTFDDGSSPVLDYSPRALGLEITPP